jgi:hypothetical protein
VRDFRRFQLLASCLVCLGFTGGHVAWAQPAQPDLYVEDPYAPHQTSGSEARVGTIVGFLYGMPQPVTELGLVAAAGQRIGRLTLEAEAAYFDLQTEGRYMSPLGLTQGDVGVGRGERLGVLARVDVFRLDSHVVGANTLLSVFAEGGAAVEWDQFTAPVDLDGTIKPDNTKRLEGVVGFGLTLDHRLQEPIGFPHRIAWFLGWRMAMAPNQAMDATVCRTETTCARTEMPMSNIGGSSVSAQSMLFQSSLAFTF